MSDFLSKVPTLDISKFKSDDENLVKEFSNDLGTSFNQTGFAIIKNHGLTNEMTNDLYDAIKSFFNIEDEKKIKYYFPELYGQRGYVIKGQEHAKGSSKGDLKEFFHIGNPVISNPKNVWPIEVINFEKISISVNFFSINNIFKGWKIGCTTPVMQKYLGIPNPCLGKDTVSN